MLDTLLPIIFILLGVLLGQLVIRLDKSHPWWDRFRRKDREDEED